METFLFVLFMIICVLLIIVVLLQKGRGGGLGAAFGGSSSSAFGTRTGDVFTWVTIVLTALFLLLAIGTTLYYRPATSAVADPQIVPGDGTTIADEIEVTIRTKTDGAAIHYTTDGSDPTRQSATYERSVRVRPGMTLKAVAIRSTWTDSRIVAAHYPQAASKTQPSDIGVPSTPETVPPTPAPATKPAPATGPAITAPEAPAPKPATAPAPASKPATTPAVPTTPAPVTGAPKPATAPAVPTTPTPVTGAPKPATAPAPRPAAATTGPA